MEDAEASENAATVHEDDSIGRESLNPAESHRFARLWRVRSLLRSSGIGLLVLALFLAWYSERFDCWSWGSLLFRDPIMVSCPTTLPTTADVTTLLAMATLALSVLPSSKLRHMMPRPPRHPGQRRARLGLVLLAVGSVLSSVDFVLIGPTVDGWLSCVGPPCQVTLQMLVYDYGPTVILASGLALWLVGSLLLIWTPRDALESIYRVPSTFSRPKGARVVPVLVASLIIILGSLAVTSAYPVPTYSCPPTESEMVANVTNTPVSRGITNGLAYPFYAHAGLIGCPGEAQFGPHLSGSASFTTVNGSEEVGALAIFLPTVWANVTSGSGGSPTWCFNVVNESCQASRNATFDTSLTGGGSRSAGYVPQGSNLLFCVWSTSNITVQLHVTYRW